MANGNIRIILPDGEDEDKWRLFRNPARVLMTYKRDEVLAVLNSVEKCVTDGLQAVGFITYEAANGFDRALKTHYLSNYPIVWFGLFDKSEEYILGENGSFSLGEWNASISEMEYNHAMGQIKNYLLKGDTYQVNYTIRLRTSFTGNYLALFQRLHASQKTQFSAFIETDDVVFCSVSPELFFTLDDDRLVSRPMKGTIRRGLTLEEDRVLSNDLLNSEKNRAENVMIVDMVRNDMGRIAVAGSVTVSRMFEIEKYPTVFQMTSTVECKTGASVTEIMQALFPCASITGAPKVRTMEIIQELEAEPRGIYTGCIGYIRSGRKAKFNVAIRTVVIDKKKELAEYGAGGGIVWDSSAEREYDECLIKAAVLKASTPEFKILETILWDDKNGYFLLDKHLSRMAGSAEYFDYRFDRSEVEKKLKHKNMCFDSGSHRVRVELSPDGEISIGSDKLQKSRERWRVGISSVKVNSHDKFLYHKTTNRTIYEDARHSISDVDDVILLNECGEITESTIANVVVEKNGKLLTPPVSCGLLAGTYRELLMEKGEIEEGIITLNDLMNGKRVFLINSVRKRVPVDVVLSVISA
ncbi:MAG: aminodeoxychorismate synthase component I [Kiritimatiellae bacterium]|nr:aminodeoxychorismate synthase component I [Kiritimatiellia bacterium]MDD5521138.1 aminodeoxychorismate synthase component I [Kiritimatiellia bacterium]